MIGAVLGNVLLGSGAKVIASVIGTFMENKRQERLASMNADLERIKVLQGGEDKADNFTKATRRILAFMLVGSWCFINVYHVVMGTDVGYRIMIDKEPSFWSGFFCSSTNKDTITVSAGALLWEFKATVEILAGFYFTKVHPRD